MVKVGLPLQKYVFLICLSIFRVTRCLPFRESFTLVKWFISIKTCWIIGCLFFRVFTSSILNCLLPSYNYALVFFNHIFPISMYYRSRNCAWRCIYDDKHCLLERKMLKTKYTCRLGDKKYKKYLLYWNIKII